MPFKTETSSHAAGKHPVTAPSSHDWRLSNSSLYNSFILIGALLIAHTPLTVDNGLFGDDWLLFDLKPGYPVNTDFLIHGAGHPFLYAYCTLGNWLGAPILFMKVLALAGIGIGAFSLNNFVRRLRVFSQLESSIFVFIVWSYAGYQNWASKLTATYIFSFGLLCLGLNLFLIVAQSDRSRGGLRLVALVVIFCSFSLNSMIAAYGIGLFSVFLIDMLQERDFCRKVFPRLIPWIKDFGDFLAIPFVYWFTVRHLFPKIGPYEDYYRISLPNLESLSIGLANFWVWGFVRLPEMGFSLMKESRLSTIAALLVGIWVTFLAAKAEIGPWTKARASLYFVTWPIAAGAATFIAFSLPYIVSGIHPTGHFYESRHLILFGIPLGLLFVFTYRSTQLISNSWTARALVVLCLSLNLCALWNSYFYQQARWLREKAMVESLRYAYQEPPAAVFNLVDGFLDHSAHAFFGTTEVTGMLHLAWDGRPLFGFTGRNERPTILQETYKSSHMEGTAFRNMDLSGPQATILLKPNEPILTNYQLSRKYYLCLITSCDKRSLITSLASVIVQVGPIPHVAPARS